MYGRLMSENTNAGEFGTWAQDFLRGKSNVCLKNIKCISRTLLRQLINHNHKTIAIAHRDRPHCGRFRGPRSIQNKLVSPQSFRSPLSRACLGQFMEQLGSFIASSKSGRLKHAEVRARPRRRKGRMVAVAVAVAGFFLSQQRLDFYAVDRQNHNCYEYMNVEFTQLKTNTYRIPGTESDIL